MKRDTRVQVMLTENEAAYVMHRAGVQARSVSQVLALMVSEHMTAHGDPSRDYTQSEHVLRITKRSNVRQILDLGGERKPPMGVTTLLRRTAS